MPSNLNKLIVYVCIILIQYVYSTGLILRWIGLLVKNDTMDLTIVNYSAINKLEKTLEEEM